MKSRRSSAARQRHHVERGLPALFVLVAAAALPQVARSACFNDINAGLTVVDGTSLAWGDYDNDGDLDILLAGRAVTTSGAYVAKVYRNSGGSNPTFAEAAYMPGAYHGAVAWGDYDHDGNLDVLVSGLLEEGSGVAWIYRNNGGPNPTFSYVPARLSGIWDGTVSWGDYDNDGDLDVLLVGTSAIQPLPPVTKLYRNEGGAYPTFSDIGASLPTTQDGSAAWGDFDKDGDLDVLLTGVSGGTDIYQSTGGTNPTFSPASVGFDDARFGSSGAFGDYDGDGDLDALLTGMNSSSPEATIYRATNGFFSDVVHLTGVHNGVGAWGDCDNDGDLDALVVGYHTFGLGSISRVYRNSGPSTFTDMVAGLPGVGGDLQRESAAWGDYDNDGDLDILIAGLSDQSPFVLARVYRNDCATTPNTPPTAPTNLAVNIVGSSATFSWNAATDAQTPAAALSYNLRVGTAPGAGNIVSPMADTATGKRRIPALGNTNLRTSWTIQLPGSGPFFWSVQAIDNSYAGSAFAPEAVTGGTTSAVLSEEPVEEVWSRAPNPFSGATTIRFSQPSAGPVSLLVYDVAGRCVRTLDDREIPAGEHASTWDGRDDAGRLLPSGVYFARLKTASLIRSEKIVLAR